MSSTQDTRTPSTTPVALIVLAWLLVALPLAYGLFQTVKTAIPLFTG
ncbi:MAG: hypothetical protein JWQ53_152 [Klenkia sp.]|nr:hypothetical protein [Klenkia sp.]